MKIFYDGAIFAMQKAGGVNRYFSEIIQRLPAEFRPIFYSESCAGLFFPTHPHLRKQVPPPLAGLLRPLIEQGVARCEIVHPTYYHLTHPLEWTSFRKPVVLTVYDFVFWRYGHRYERSEKLLRAQDEAIRRADLILCISHSTRSDLLERFPDCEDRSLVTHLATSRPEEAAGPNTHERPYFLFVGARTFYKNFDLAVRGLAELSRQRFDADLVAVGAPWTDSERKMFLETGMQDRVRLVDYPSDLELGRLYEHAVALIYPSEYEGFGLPLLEAMVRGTPVIALRSSSIPEVAGDGGILIEPQEATPEALANAARRLLENSSLRESLSCAARVQAGRFSWERTAAETLAAYRRAAAL